MSSYIDHSKRGMIKMLGATVAASAFAPSSVYATSSEEHNWDEEYDVVIVGSGFAGLAGAVEAVKLGVAPSKVIVLEKMPYYGGNSVICHGNANFVGTELQKQMGITDSEELLLADQLKSGRGYSNPNLLKHVISLGDYCYRLTTECGAVYQHIEHGGGSSVPRAHGVVERSGVGIIRPMLKTIQDKGVVTEKRAKFENLLFDKNGDVEGIRVRRGYHFGEEESGRLVNMKARLGVLMATGGFGQNVALRSALDPSLTDEVACTNAPGATGDGLIEMVAAGANAIHMSFIQMGPWASPDEGGFGVAAPYSIYNFPHSIAIELNTGRRFMDELADRKIRSDAIFRQRDSEGNPKPPILITAKAHAERNYSLANVLKYGVGKEFASLEQIAAEYDIPLKPLKEQLEDWNQYVSKGKDEQFGKPMEYATQLGEMKPPFTVIRLWPKVHYCQGGVQINTRAEVISMKSGQPIKGLFAAGEVTGGVHGVSRLGGCAVPDCLAMGVTAARTMVRG